VAKWATNNRKERGHEKERNKHMMRILRRLELFRVSERCAPLFKLSFNTHINFRTEIIDVLHPKF
jgi:hypothetical protein